MKVSNSLICRKEMRLRTFLVALFTSSVIFLPFIILDGGMFFYVGDYNSQQVPFYIMCHRAIREGNFNWSWCTDLGANFVGSYAYYTLGSPFFWVMLLFPTSFVPYLIAPMLALKIALSALTAYIYIRRYTKTPNAACIGGLLYAFSGWSIYNIFFNQFHEALVIFPLVLYGLDELVLNKRKGIFGLAVFAAAIMNYYMFIQIAVFTIIYWAVRSICKSWQMNIKTFFTIAIEAILGFLMASILFIPAVLAVTQVPRVSNIINGWHTIAYNGTSYFVMLFSALFMPECPPIPVLKPSSEMEFANLTLWMPLCGLIGTMVYMLNRKKDWITKLLITSAVFLLIPGLNAIFNTFNSNLYMRWLFMPILFCALACVKAFEKDGISFKKPTIATAVTMVIIALAVLLIPIKSKDGSWSLGLWDTSSGYTNRIFILIATLTLSFASLIMFIDLLRLRKKINTVYNKNFFISATSYICIISIFVSMVAIASGRGYSNDADYFRKIEVSSTYELPKLENGNRVDTLLDNLNVGICTGIPSANGFISVAPGSIYEYYDYLGGSRLINSSPKGDDYAARSFLSVRYVMCNLPGYLSFYNYYNQRVEDGKLDYYNPPFDKEGNILMPGYTYINEQNDFKIYENEYCLPQGITLDSYYTKDDTSKNTYEEKSKLLLKGMLLTDEQIDRYSDYFENRLIIDKNTEYSEESYYKDCIEIINGPHATDFKINNSGFTCAFSSDHKELVLFQVPYESGWSAYVDDREVEIEKVDAGFMAIPVESGKHSIVFKYTAPGLKIGIIVSLVSVGIFLLYLSAAFALNRKSKSA